MCGISGSSIRERGYQLFNANLNRGVYSSSVTCLYKKYKQYSVTKVFGVLQLDEVPVGADYYLFHSRGPTVETTAFDINDNHPFCYGRYIVAHNGIIENANALYMGADSGVTDIGVDSRIIPYLLDREHMRSSNKIDVIQNIISKLKGTFGLWIYDTSTGLITVIRSDVSLFHSNTEFTSSPFETFTPLDQNVLYSWRMTDNCMVRGMNIVKKPKYFIAN